MASQQHDAVFREVDMDDDDEESQEDEEYEEDDDVLPDDEENLPSPSTALAVTVAVPGSAATNGGTAPISTPTATAIVVTDSSPDLKRRRVDQIEEKKAPPPPALDDSRRLFQRLWTDEDEIELLQGFLDYTSQRGSSSHHNDTALFYDQIKSKLQLDFNKNQLVEKIRRLKKKYRNVLNKIGSGKEFSFKSAHDQATFEISRKIWSNVAPIGDNSLDDDEINPSPNANPNPNLNLNPNLNHSPIIFKNEMIFRNSAEKKTPKRSRPRSAVKIESNDGSASNRDHNCISNATTTPITPTTATANTTTANIGTSTTNNNGNSGGYSNNIPSLIEETVRSCLSPVLKELLAGAMGGGPFGGRGGLAMNMNPMALMNLSFGGGGELVDEKWRKQQILELEVYSKRLELVQDQIKAAMEELRSNGA